MTMTRMRRSLLAAFVAAVVVRADLVYVARSGPAYQNCGTGRVAVALCGSQTGTKCGQPSNSRGEVSNTPSYATVGCATTDWFMNPDTQTEVSLGHSRWLCTRDVGSYLRCASNEVMTGVCGSGSGTDCNSGRASSHPGGSCSNARMAIECTVVNPGFTLSSQAHGPAGANNREYADCHGILGNYRSGADLNKVMCGACLSGSGKDCASRNSRPVCCDIRECGAGEAGVTSGVCTSCSAGTFKALRGAGACTSCAKGRYQHDGGASACVSAPKGTFTSAPGATAPTICSPGFYNDQEGQTSCRGCPRGRVNDEAPVDRQVHDDLGDCALCPAGRFSSSEGSTACEPARKGYFVATAGEHSETACPFGTYQSEGGQIGCLPCGDDERGPNSRFLTAQSTLTDPLDCACEPGFTGTNCDLAECAPTLPVISLGLLLLEASYPEELRESNTPKEERLNAVVSTRTRTEGIFRGADANGDDRLSEEEAKAAMVLVDVDVAGIEDGRHVWSTPLADSSSFEPTNDVTITEMIDDVVANFLDYGTFFPVTYDVGSPLVNDTFVDMVATYPNSAYDTATCEKESESGRGGVELVWKFRFHATTNQQLQKQCAYVNGVLLPDDVFTNEMSDAAVSGPSAICSEDDGANEVTTCDFFDARGVANDNRKRLYCIRSFFCGPGSCGDTDIEDSFTTTRCTTALAFDGTPADIIPTYSIRDGVKFQWLDTALDEAGFRVFRGFKGDSTNETGQLIADIPVRSGACGQQFAPLSFADRDTGGIPATRVEYVVATVDADGGLMKQNRVQYTSPWVMMLTITVETEAAGPARDVLLRINHLLEVDGKRVVDPEFELFLETDAFGTAVHELRVIDPVRWSQQQQHLRVTPYKCEGGESEAFGSECVGGLLHTFATAFEDVTVRHLYENSVELVDTSAYSVRGYVVFGEGPAAATWRDEAYFGRWDVPWAAVPPECPYETDDERCCPVVPAEIELTFGDGETETADVDESGFFTIDVLRGRNVTITFGGYEDHPFDLWTTAFDGADAGALVATGVTPAVTVEFVDGNIDVVFVDAARGELEALVVGGHDDVRFVTGQRLVVRREGCGYAREVVTRASVANVTVLAAAVTVEIPQESSLEARSDPDRIEACLDTDASYGTACRVEAPQFHYFDDTTRLSCAADLPDLDTDASVGGIDFIDEFFDGRPDRVQQVDFTADFWQRRVFRYLAPLCLASVRVGPGGQRTTLSALDGSGDARQVSDNGGATSVWDTFRREQLLVAPPAFTTDDAFGSASTTSGEAIFRSEDLVEVRFALAEVYPPEPDDDVEKNNCVYPWSYHDGTDDGCTLQYDPLALDDKRTAVPLGSAATGFSGDDVKVTVLDGISGKDLEVDAYVYDGAACAGLVTTTCVGLALAVQVGDPNPFAPFTVTLDVVFRRAHDSSTLHFARDAIIAGVIPEDVPQLFQMTTDPSLVFAVIRDPPGGSSTTTLRKGSKLTTSMSIDGMHSAQRSKSTALSFNQGATADLSAVTAPLGLGLEKNLLGLKIERARTYSGAAPSVQANRGSGQDFDLSFTFDVDISTSTSPWTAGQASDVIVGGGANLRVAKAIEVRAEPLDDDLTSYNISASQTSVWHPEQISTFVTSVREIESTIERMGRQYLVEVDQGRESDGDPKEKQRREENAAEVQLGIRNWQTILATYRAQTVSEDTTSVFEALQGVLDHFEVVFSDASRQVTWPGSLSDRFEAFNERQNDAADYASFLSAGLEELEENQRNAAVATSATAAAGGALTINALRQRLGKPAKIVGAIGTFLAGDFVAAAGLANSESKTSASLIRGLADDVGAIAGAALEANCHGGGDAGTNAGDLCDAAAFLKSRVDLASKLLGVCDLEAGVLPAVDRFCRREGGKSGDLPRSVLDFLGDDTRVLTFGGGSTVTMTSTVAQRKAVSQESNYETSQSDAFDSNANFCFSALRRERNRRLLAAETTSSAVADRVEARGLHDRRLLLSDDRRLLSDDLLLGDDAERRLLREEEAPQCSRRLFDVGAAFANAEAGSISVSLGRSAQRDKGASHTVSFVLGDPDPDDFFAVRIASDPVYATPVFETLGGTSTCPGETATTKRDSFVTVERINYDYCAGFPLCQNVPYGSTVTLGVVIQNLSPLGSVDFQEERNSLSYRLFVGSDLGKYDAGGTDYCGEPGNAAGLKGLITGGGLLVSPPYGQSEVLLTLDHFTECLDYKGIRVKIIASCEFDTPTYQYSTRLDPDTGVVTVLYPVFDNETTLDWLDDDDTLPNMPRRYASSDSVSEATFSIGWAPAPRRTLSEVSSDDDDDDSTTGHRAAVPRAAVPRATTDGQDSFKLMVVVVVVLTAVNTLLIGFVIAFVAWNSSQQKKKARDPPRKNHLQGAPEKA